MQELVKIQSRDGRKVISARELHAFLEVKTRFDIWMQRMFEYGCKRGEDYIEVAVTKNGHIDNQGLTLSAMERTRAGISTDYLLTLRTAQHISMVQRSEKGQQARDYFVDCERRLWEYRQQVVHEIPKTKGQALLEAAQALLRLEAQQTQLEQQQQLLIDAQPKVDYYDRVMNSDGLLSVEQVAKTLAIQGLGRNNLFEFLRNQGVIRQAKNGTSLPYQPYVDRGFFRLIQQEVVLEDKTVVRTTIKVTPAGVAYIARLTERIQVRKTPVLPAAKPVTTA